MSELAKKSIVEKLLSIGATSEASIKKKIARENFGDDFQSVLDAKVLEHFKDLKDIEVVDGEHEFTAEILWRDGRNMYFSSSDGWVPVKDEDIAIYKLNFNWFIRQIMKALDIEDRHEPKEILEDSIWGLGQHWIETQNVHIVIARNISQSVVLDSLNQYLNRNHKTGDPALVLSLDRRIPSYLNLPRQNVLVRLEEAMVIEGDKFKLNTRLLAGKMGGSVSQDGFSGGFRNLVVNGKKYQFTKKQAEAVELMHKAGNPRHQDEILAEIHSSQKKLLYVFRSKGINNPAWGEVIKNDRKGNHWLEL